MLLQSPRLSGEERHQAIPLKVMCLKAQTRAIHAGLVHASTGSRRSKGYVLNPKTAKAGGSKFCFNGGGRIHR